MDNFTIRQNNPNQERGGNGCLCSDMKDRDCHGPYVVWDATDMASPDNPYPVACRTCIEHALRDMDTKPPIDHKVAEAKPQNQTAGRGQLDDDGTLPDPEKDNNGFVQVLEI